jgi:hypothetical protein
MLGTLALAIEVVGVPRSVASQPWWLPVFLGLGALLGWAAMRAYDAVLRIDRRQQRSSRSVAARRLSQPPSMGVSFVRPDLAGAGAPRSGMVLSHLIACAVLEELLFRGVIVQLALASSTTAGTALILALSIALFGAAHADLGPAQAFAFVPLGVINLVATLVTGSVVPAVIAHVVVNARAWWATRQRSVEHPGRRPLSGWRPSW